MGALFGNRRWMARDISMNTKARNASDAGRVAPPQKGNKNRTRDREDEWRRGDRSSPRSRNVEASRIGSRVRSIVNHGGSAKRNSHSQSRQSDCMYAFLSEVMYTGSHRRRHPLGIYIVSAHCWLAHIFVVATYKSSAFPLTSHYRT